MGIPMSLEMQQAEIFALGQLSMLGRPVSREQVNKILRMCKSENDRRVLRELCDSFGLPHSA
jgi:hypothetical protein